MTERGFDTGFWTSPFAIDLPKDAKLLHAYCRTNQHCNQAGLYPIAVKTISFETGIPAESIPDLFDLLKPEIVWYPEANLVWVKHFLKEQAKSSKFVMAALSCLGKDSLPEDIVAEFQMYNQKIFIEANVHPQLSLTRRECVIIRDNFRCQYCGKELKEVADYEMDHIMPRISGGKDNYQNLVASCVKCARLKAGRSPKDAGLHVPQAMPFHGTQALFLLKTDNKIRERWLSLFPERQRSVQSMLSNVVPGYTIDTISRININPGYTTNSNANASANANARAPKKGKGVAKRGREGTTPRSESEIEESLSEADREVISIWRSVEGFDLSEADEAALVARLRTEFPDIDLVGESKAWAARKISEPITRRSRPSGQIWNWMKLARHFAQQRREGKPGGQRNRLPSTGPGPSRGRLPTDAEREDSIGVPLR